MEERRSDKYEKSENTPERNSRVKKNRCLYEEINSKIGFEEITHFESNTEIDLSALNIENPNRSDYQKIKEYKDLLGTRPEEKKENIEREFKPRNFDINLVLEEAKKNRETDELEQKRNLKKEEYSVLSNLNKKYLHKKNITEDDEEDLRELINTATNLNLKVEEDDEKDLLSELLATTVDIKLESELSEEDLKELYNYKIDDDSNENSDEEEKEDDELENTFYTKSMELSKEDLMENINEEDEEFYKGKKKGNGLKIALILMLLVAMIAIVVYFVIKHM